MFALALNMLHTADTSAKYQTYDPETIDQSSGNELPVAEISAPVASAVASAAPCSSHLWEKGVCAVCGEPCLHPTHDSETQLCSECGQKVCHQYRDLICSCGKKLHAEELYIEPFLFYPSDNPGRIETIEYDTPDYSGHTDRTYTKKMDVYLPPEYSTERKYNVVLMLPGTGSDHTYWFETDHPYKYPDETVIDVNLRNLFDNMIGNCLCEPFIAVSLTYYKNADERSVSDNYDRISDQLSSELKNDILPTVITHFSTYAKGADGSSISEAREHFGYIGASAGSILGFRSALMGNPDIFGWFGFLSGCKTPSAALVSALQDKQNTEYPICGFYAASGISDPLREGLFDAYKALYNSGLIGENNSIYNDIHAASHEDRAWITGIYNCMQLFFSQKSSKN